MRAAIAGVALLAAFAAPASAGAERFEVGLAGDGGRLRIDLPGGERLVESAARGGAGGRFAFLSDGEWHHATKPVRDDEEPDGWTLRTDDPDGRRIAVRVRGGSSGTLGISARVIGDGPTVNAVGVGFAAPESERMLGFGERSNRVDQRGRTVENYVGEGPYQPGEYGVPAATLPPWGFHEREDATYFPMPWLLSSRGYGVLAKNPETSRFHLASIRADEWSFDVDSNRLSLRVVAGPRPANVVERLTEITGRQPKPAAPWLFGPWVQTGHQNTAPDEVADLEILRRADAPVSVAETHMRYMPCGSDLGQEASEAARTDALNALGLATVTYTREAICSSYEEPFARAVAADAFLERADGTPYTFQGFVGSGVTQIGMFDFTDPDAAPIYNSILDRAYAAGYDGWMEDYGEYAPPESVFDNGMTGARGHNLHPVYYHRAGWRYARAQERPIVRFIRSGWTGVHPYAQIVWGGDPTTGWGFDGLRSAVREALTMGLSGISLWGSDIGGFFTLSDERLDPELLARWLEFGAFSGVMRTKAEGIGVPASARPQVWEEETLPIYRRYAKLRTQLYPYLAAADREYRRSGMPIMRQLALEFPGDRRALRREDQFMFGPDLLVSPVLRPGESDRRLYLPGGRWVNLWEAARYRDRDGALELGRAELLRGGRSLTVAAPVDEIPLMARAGALLPMLPPNVDTLSPYAAEDNVGLEDARGSLRLLALPRAASRARFHGGGRLRSSEIRGGGWRLRVAAPRRIKLEVQASLATLERPFAPHRVEVNGRRAGGWSYDEETGVIEFQSRVREGVIRVLPRP
jgi:alpha-glucosidase (family GH31 glycosyl hydrolase)